MFIIIRLCICFHLSYTYLYKQKTHLQLQITKAVLITCLKMENQPLAWKNSSENSWPAIILTLNGII